MHTQTNMHTYTPNHLLKPYSQVLVKMILKDYISILFYASNLISAFLLCKYKGKNNARLMGSDA